MAKLRGMDQFELVFTKMEDLQGELDRREAATLRPVVHTDSVEFQTIREAEVYDTVPKAPEELIEDTKENSEMVIVAGKASFLLDSTSFNTIKSRIEVFGAGFDALTLKTRRLVMNERFEQIKREVRLIVIDDKVRAVMSAGTSQSYAVIPMADVVREIVKAMGDRFEKPIMKQAVLNYDMLSSYFVFPGMKEELSKLYNVGQWIPGIRLSTSDTGNSANSLTPYWSKSGSTRGMALQGESINLEHRGEATVQDIINQLPKLFSRFQNVAKWMTDAMMMEVKSPKSFVTAIGKHLGLSKKFILDVLNIYDGYKRPEATTVFTLAEHFFEALEYAESKSDYLENQVGKLFSLSMDFISKLAERVEEEAEQIELFAALKV